MLGALVVVLVALGGVLLKSGVYRVDDGHLGVCYWGGQLMEGTQPPGIALNVPFLTRCESIPIQMKTRVVRNIPCGSAGGTLVHFASVEVVYRLRSEAVVATVRNYSLAFPKLWIDDRVHHEVNQYCSRHELRDILIEKFDEVDDVLLSEMRATLALWAPGLEIIAIRMTKPIVPRSIEEMYEKLEEEKTKLKMAMQTQELVAKEAENARRTAVRTAQKERSLSEIEMASAVAKQQSEVAIAAVGDAMLLANEQGRADAERYAAAKRATSESALLTPEFLAHERLLEGARNLKVRRSPFSSFFLLLYCFLFFSLLIFSSFSSSPQALRRRRCPCHHRAERRARQRRRRALRCPRRLRSRPQRARRAPRSRSGGDR